MSNSESQPEDKTESVVATENAPQPAKSSLKFNVVKFEKRVSATFSILYKLFVVSAIILASVFVFRELLDDSFHIQQVNVPVS